MSDVSTLTREQLEGRREIVQKQIYEIRINFTMMRDLGRNPHEESYKSWLEHDRSRYDKLVKERDLIDNLIKQQ
jgi:hypothetical protein